MRTELILLLVDSGCMNRDAQGVYKPVYKSLYSECDIRDMDGYEWAYIAGAWTLVRVSDTGVRYVVTNNKDLK